ncbi:E3 ubiquitin-protein ligase WAV3-like [Primulina tabacum]|uniref:E3 ubiquitin-protein ligase WAV3-like n=1 Tax=Primulina tabacum TaxID=48773 RepID=UPI003F5A6D97
MASSGDSKTCAICLGRMESGKGQAIFTAECSHSFHFSCISNCVTYGNYVCPVCRAKWNDLPFTVSSPNPANQVPQPQVPVRSRTISEREPIIFSDDEPLPLGTVDAASSASLADLQNVSVKAIPERPAIASSEFVPEFAVLVGIRAPSLSEDAHQFHRAPIDLVTVLDVSGSMHGSKLALLKRAVDFVIDNLGPSDRLSIVSFSTFARRILPLRRMTEQGRQNAKWSVNSLSASGSTNIVEALKKGVQVLEERRHQNPVSSIIFLSDGRDTCNHGTRFQILSSPRQSPQYLHLLPTSICPENRGTEDHGQRQTFPVHAFGFGTDHDPLTMHAISDASGGTFSFIESYEMVQDAFASCIGGLLSVVIQELRLMVRSASHGIEIKSISSGRYASEITNEGSQGLIKVGDLYADEEKEFLINLAVPVYQGIEDDSNITSLLDITCSYRAVMSNDMIQIDGDLVAIQRPKSPSPLETAISFEVDRQKNRLSAAESIREAQQMAETGNLLGARALLSDRRSTLLASASGQAGDGLCLWLEGEMKEIDGRMASMQLYERTGRAYALSNMSSHANQRATTRGSSVPGASFSFGAGGAAHHGSFNAYATPSMANMVSKSHQLNKTGDSSQSKE